MVLLWTGSVFAQPYEPNVLWDRSGLTDSSAYGYAILPLGDQNDDGFADWAVLAGGNGGAQRGYLEFFHGAETLLTEPYFVYYSDTSVYLAGFGVRAVGDINGDGYEDWILEHGRRPNEAVSDYFLVLGGVTPPNPPQLFLTLPVNIGLKGVQDINGDGNNDIRTYDFNADILRI